MFVNINNRHLLNLTLNILFAMKAFSEIFCKTFFNPLEVNSRLEGGESFADLLKAYEYLYKNENSLHYLVIKQGLLH